MTGNDDDRDEATVVLNGKASHVTVVIVNFNSGDYLARAVEALKAQTYRAFTTVVVDNASTDDSLSRMREHFPDVKVINATQNLGFAGGNNLAVSQCGNSEWIALLNPDAFPDRGWLNHLLLAAAANPDFSCFASHIVFDSNPAKLDGAGDEYHVSGFAWRRGQGLGAASQFADCEVFMASATAALYRKAAFEHAGGFDERYFCYYEDVDLGVRLRLLKYRSWYVADAVVRHVGSGITGKGSAFVARHTQRNRIWTYVKDMPTPWIWLLLPLHIFYQTLALLHYTRQGRLKAALHGTLEALQGLPPILESRRSIQNGRRASWKEFTRTMRWSLLAPLFRK